MWFLDYYGRNIELTEERWQHIIKEHPELKGLKNKIGEVLLDPDYIKKSKRDSEVELFYKFKCELYNGKYLLVTVKVNKRCFILTAYITDTIRKGDTKYDKKTENVL